MAIKGDGDMHALLLVPSSTDQRGEINWASTSPTAKGTLRGRLVKKTFVKFAHAKKLGEIKKHPQTTKLLRAGVRIHLQPI